MIPEIAEAINRFMTSSRGDEEPALDWWKKGYFLDPKSVLGRRMLDFDVRLREMDADGIDMQLLSPTAPGVQIFDPDEATALAQLVNDRLTDVVSRHPTRFQGMATVAPHDPKGSIVELERAITKLGLKGVMINTSTRGHYLDEPQFRPLLEAIQDLDVPLYIHPREPSPQMLGPYKEYALRGAMWGYAAETGLHGMRLVLGGVFDALPKLKVVLGHGGEAIPYWLDRIDNRMASPTNRPDLPKLKRPPSEYIRNNLWVTTSGMNWEPVVKFCQDVMGEERVLFAVDYPLEDQPFTIKRVDAMTMSQTTRELFYSGNAKRLFKL